jgi:hypothetical protein
MERCPLPVHPKAQVLHAMTHFLHHFLWLLRRFRRVLFYYLLAWAVVITAVWTVPQYFYAANILFTLHGALAAVAVLLLLAVVWQDPAPGTDTFWRTRPPRWRAMWASQLLFTLLCVAGPFVVCWMVNGMMLDCTAQQWQRAAQDLAVVMAMLLACGGMLSFTRGWYSMLLAGISGYGIYILGLFLMVLYWQPVNPQMDYAWSLLPRLVVSAGLLPGIAGLLVWGMGLRGHSRLLRGVMLGAILAGGPCALWPVLQSGPGEDSTLELVRADLATVAERRAQPAGNMILRGLPPGTAWLPAIGLTVFRHTEMDRIRILNAPRAKSGGYELAGVRYNPPGWENHHSVLSTLPAKPIQDYLGAGIQLYSTRNAYGSSGRPPVPGWFVSWDKNVQVPITVTGTEQGLFYRLAPLASVPLEEGASAAERGTRLRVRGISPGGQKLHVLADMHFASGFVSRFFPPEGEPMPASQPWIPLIHFPAGEFAILVNNEKYSDPRSLGTSSLQLDLHTYIPAAEAIQGRTFTPELLRGAQLHLFALVSDGPAKVVCHDQTFAIPGAAAAPDGDIPQLLDALTGPRDDASMQAAKRLAALGPAAARALLAREWPPLRGLLSEPAAYGNDFWKNLITSEVLPDLAAAMRHDARWIAVAWITGHEGLAAAPALEHLKNSRGTVAQYVLASAARVIQTVDYPALMRALPGNSAWSLEVGSNNAATILWPRLRALPGFDWKAAAHTHWRNAWINDETTYAINQPLRAAAALAGEASAFNALLEDEQALRDRPGGLYNYHLTAAEWDALYAMIENLPPDPGVRNEWLRERRGRFVWAEAADKYQVAGGN